jgi:hypothetical protein
MAYQLSPGVAWSEIDLTTVVPAVSTTVGAIAGDFEWGPVDVVTSVSNEVDLVGQFGLPSDNVAQTWFTASSFLAYADDLRVVRSTDASSRNAAAGNTAFLIKNRDDWEINWSNITNISPGNSFAGMVTAKYPATVTNGLKVFVFSSNVAITDSTWTSWPYQSQFSAPPGTSKYASDRAGANDELHIVVVDMLGTWTGGAANSVVEKFSNLSKARDAKNYDGSSNYWVNVIADQSKFLWPTSNPVNTSIGGFDSTTWGSTAANTTFAQNGNGVYSLTLSNGLMTLANTGSIQNSYVKFSDTDAYDISLIMMGGASNVVAQYVIQNIGEPGGSYGRGDSVVFVSPRYVDCVNKPGQEVNNIIATRNSLGSSSYGFMDSGFKRTYDQYNNGGVYRWVPLNGDTAGLCARTDKTRDAWFSPAGLNRGQIKNVTKLSWSPSKADRDNLYKNGINPVVTFKGEGTVLYGDKTLQVKPSAFDRINVRRLFIVLEKSISRAAKYSLFEFNDEFTRSQFVALVEPFLRDVKGRRGIYDFKVVCDDTNNTQQVIDSNQFVGDIYIKPARSINFIQLNFVAVRSGVAFSEIVGQF